MLHDAIAARRRADAIERLGLLERRGDPDLTALARVAAHVSGAGAAAIHVFDETHQRRIAAVRAPLDDHGIDDSMCRLALESGETIVCPDATADPRFDYSSFTTEPDPVRFYATVPVRNRDRVALGTVCVFDTVARELSAEQVGALEDLATQVEARLELVRIARDLEHAASHDPLTGCVNRLLLLDRYALAQARARRDGVAVMVAVVDIDGFKRINDEHGHVAGDRVLVDVARSLSRAVRAQDTVARIGGDEFALLAEVRPEGEADLLARLRDALRAAVEGPRLSIGSALAGADEELADVLARADAGMYARKAVG